VRAAKAAKILVLVPVQRRDLPAQEFSRVRMRMRNSNSQKDSGLIVLVLVPVQRQDLPAGAVGKGQARRPRWAGPHVQHGADFTIRVAHRDQSPQNTGDAGRGSIIDVPSKAPATKGRVTLNRQEGGRGMSHTSKTLTSSREQLAPWTGGRCIRTRSGPSASPAAAASPRSATPAAPPARMSFMSN